MFVYKNSKELEALTNEELDQYKADLKAHEAELQKTTITDIVKAQLAQGKTDLEKFLGEEIANQLAEFKGNQPEKRKTILEEVIEKKDDIIKMIKGSSDKELELKTTTTRASLVNSASQDLLPTIGQLGYIKRSLYNLFAKVDMSIGNDAGKVVYHDWDEATTIAAATSIAEGTQFPESTAKFAKYSIDLKKIGDTLPVSEEFGEDEASAAAELEMFINVNITTAVDAQIANGDGTGLNLTGLIASSPAYVAVASGIKDANIYDLAKRVRTDIVKNRGSKYSPDFIAMNANTIDQLLLKKDAMNNYIFPDVNNIGSMEIIEDNHIPDNQMIVGDSRFGRIYEKGGVTLKRVFQGLQAVEEIYTILGRTRLLFLIRNVDKTGFRKVTDINAALTLLAT